MQPLPEKQQELAQQQQPENGQEHNQIMVNEEPIKNQTIVLFDLNDFHLKNLLDYLPLSDLAAIAETCTRFAALTQDEFRLKKEASIYKIVLNSDLRENLPQIEKILRSFGAFMIEVRLLFRDDFCQCNIECVDAIFQHLLNYCANSLHCLAIYNLNRPLPVTAHALFAEVPQLVFENCHKTNIIFEEIQSSNCVSLEFRKTSAASCINMEKCIFPNLTSFVIKRGYDSNDQLDISQFLQNHQWSIQKLSIWPAPSDTSINYGYQSRPYDYEIIATLNNLEELELFGSPFNDSVKKLSELGGLKRLSICEFDFEHYETQPCAEFLYYSHSATTLEYLELRYIEFGPQYFLRMLNRFCNLHELALMCVPNISIYDLLSLNDFNQLHTLRVQHKFEYGIGGPELCQFMENFPRLEQIHLRSWIKVAINEDAMDELSRFCRDKKRKLHLCLCGADKQNSNIDVLRFTNSLFKVTAGSCSSF